MFRSISLVAGVCSILAVATSIGVAGDSQGVNATIFAAPSKSVLSSMRPRITPVQAPSACLGQGAPCGPGAAGSCCSHYCAGPAPGNMYCG